MQLIRATLTAALLATASAGQPALACSIALTTPGTLKLSADGTRLGSQELGALPAALVVTSTSLFSSTLTVGAPTLSQYPGTFSSSNANVEVAYTGTGLASFSQAYTTAQTSVTIPGILGTVLLTLNNRITTSTGFASGNYQSQTVLTCS